MKTTTAAWLVVCALLVSASARAVQVPFINGYAFFDNYNTVPVNNGNVRLCSHPYVDSTCYAVLTQYTGQYYANYINFPDDSMIYIFAWIDAPYAADGRTGRWGSSTIWQKSFTACQYRNQYGWCYNYGIIADLHLDPSPLEPLARYPMAYATNVPTQNVTFKWTPGRDSWRPNNIVYEIWGSGYSSPLLRQASNLPCNPDALGNCQWVCPVNLVPNTPYNWKVVAKALHPSGALTTESVVFHFNTGN